jgi:predicted metal-dependent TIM-barrel fold hydrolase
LDKPSVLVSEIRLNKNTRNELNVLNSRWNWLSIGGKLICIHTPHLNDKLKGTRMMRIT